MAKARALKFCTQGDYIKSCQMDDKSPLKGAWFCSRDPFLCTTVEVHDGLLFIAPMALEATTPKVHWFDLLQSW